MAWLGGVLLVGGGLWWALLRCGEKRRRLRLGRELCRQLPMLERGVLVQRRPLWELAEELSRSGGETAFFWAMLGRRLMGEESCACCWRSATGVLPAPYDDLLGPLGEALAGDGCMAGRFLFLIFTRMAHPEFSSGPSCCAPFLRRVITRLLCVCVCVCV